MLTRRSLLSLFGLVLFPAIARSNPVSPTELPPDAELLAAFIVEVAIVTALVWKCRLRLLLFVPAWYLLNLLSFYVLVPGYHNVIYVSHLYVMNSLVILIGMEAFVICVEGSILYAVSRLPLFRTEHSRALSWRWAVLATFAGNCGSFIAKPLLSIVTSHI